MSDAWVLPFFEVNLLGFVFVCFGFDRFGGLVCFLSW